MTVFLVGLKYDLINSELREWPCVDLRPKRDPLPQGRGKRRDPVQVRHQNDAGLRLRAGNDHLTPSGVEHYK